MKRIFITGGHFAPALAVIEELLSRGGFEIFYIGRKFAMEDDRAEALEYRELSNLRYLTITTGRLQRKFFVDVWQSVKALAKIVVGFGQSFFWVIKYRPDVVLSFGGYVALPVVISGFVLGVPVVTHEQTAVSGLANKIIAFFAEKILVSWPASLARFPEEKVVLTGNPVRKGILAASKIRLKDKEHRPVIYITGGNLGSHAINEAVARVLPDLLEKYEVIHQTGASEKFRDFEKLSETVRGLPDALRRRYRVFEFLSTEEADHALRSADLVVGRAGANTVTELLVLGKPALLIPIPWAGGNEQLENARLLDRLGMAEIIPQDELTTKTLLLSIEKMMGRLAAYRAFAEKARQGFPVGAVKAVCDEMEKILR